MEKTLIEFISQHINLSEDEIKTICELHLIKRYKKGTFLLRAGEVAKDCYFILQGCIRSYYLIDGEEKNTAFFTENQVATPISYTTGNPSEYYLSCLEDSIVCVGNQKKTNLLLQRIPKLESIGHILNGERVIENQLLFDTYKTLIPEKRYLKLLETRPDLCNRVPQYHLASYLGIKPESLSRIRKRMVTNKA